MADAQKYAQDIVGEPFESVTPSVGTYIKDTRTGSVRFGPKESIGEDESAISPEETPVVKYGGLEQGLETGLRSGANLLTLGGYAALSDRFRTPEELQAIKERDKFHPYAQVAGEVVPYLLPYTKLGTLGKIVGAVPELGGTVAGTVFKGESAAVGKLMTHFATDAATQAFSEGVNQESLDGFSKESLGNIISHTVISAGIGAGLGGAVGKIAPYARDVLGKKTTPKPGELPKFEPPEEFFNAENVRKEVAENRASIANIYNEAAPLFNTPTQDLTTTQLKQRGFFSDYFSMIGSDPKLTDHYFVTGVKNLDSDYKAFKDGWEVSEKWGGEGRPVNKPLDALSTSVNDTIKEFSLYRSKIAAKRDAFNPKDLDIQMNPQNQSDLVMGVALGENSFVNKTRNSLRELLDPSTAASALNSVGLDRGFVSDLLTALEGSADKSGVISPKITKVKVLSEQLGRQFDDSVIAKSVASLEKKAELRKQFIAENIPKDLVSQEVPSGASNVWEFLETFRKSSGEIYANKLKTLTPQEKALYAQVRQGIREEFSKLGPDALKHMEATDTFDSISKALDEVKTSLKAPKKSKNIQEEGKKLQGGVSQELIHPDSFKPLASFNESTGRLSLKNFEPALSNYYEQLSLAIPKLEGIYGESGSDALSKIALNGEKAIEFYTDVQKLSNQSMKRWYAAQKSVIKKPDDLFHNPTVSPVTRIIRGFEDIATGNVRSFAIQAGRLGLESLLGILSKVQNPKSFNEYFLKQVSVLGEAKAVADGARQKSNSLVSSLTSNKSAIDSRVFISKVMPYSLITHTLEGKEEIRENYRNVTRNIRSYQSDPEKVVYLVSKLQVLNGISSNLGKDMSEKALGTITLLGKQLPQEIPLTQGGGEPPLIEQAKFLDTVTAVTQPEKILDLIASGTISSEQLELSRQLHPEMHQFLTEKISYQLMKNPDLGLKERAKIKSLFPMVDCVVMPVPGAAQISVMDKTIPRPPGDQVPGTAMPKVSGMKRFDANKTYGTFSTTGGTGVR